MGRPLSNHLKYLVVFWSQNIVLTFEMFGQCFLTSNGKTFLDVLSFFGGSMATKLKCMSDVHARTQRKHHSMFPQCFQQAIQSVMEMLHQKFKHIADFLADVFNT